MKLGSHRHHSSQAFLLGFVCSVRIFWGKLGKVDPNSGVRALLSSHFILSER